MKDNIQFEVKYVEQQEPEYFYCQNGFQEAVARALNFAFDNNIEPFISYIRNENGTMMKDISINYYLENKEKSYKHYPNIPKSNFVDVNQISELDRGDIVQHKISMNSYVVDANYGSTATAMSSVNISNPSEWRKLKK